jgi:hypothetical protein
VTVPKNNNIQVVYLTVHLGPAPSFQIKADDTSSTTDSADCKYTGGGTNGTADKAFLQQLISKLNTAFASNSPTISLCIDPNGWEIDSDSQCP